MGVAAAERPSFVPGLKTGLVAHAAARSPFVRALSGLALSFCADLVAAEWALLTAAVDGAVGLVGETVVERRIRPPTPALESGGVTAAALFLPGLQCFIAAFAVGPGLGVARVPRACFALAPFRSGVLARVDADFPVAARAGDLVVVFLVCLLGDLAATAFLSDPGGLSAGAFVFLGGERGGGATASVCFFGDAAGVSFFCLLGDFAIVFGGPGDLTGVADRLVGDSLAMIGGVV